MISTGNTTTTPATTQIKVQPQHEPQPPPKIIEIQGPTTANVSLFGTEGGNILIKDQGCILRYISFPEF